MINFLFVAVLLMQFGPHFMKRPDLRDAFTWPVIICCGAISALSFVQGSLFMTLLWAFFCGFEYTQRRI